MPTTTDYGTWYNHTDELSLEGGIRDALGDYPTSYDVPGLVAALRDAVNAALPEGITLNGDQFFGPYPYPSDTSAAYDIRKAVASVDFWALAARHELDRQD